MDFKLSKHAEEMLRERNIQKEWIWLAIESPDWKNIGKDDNIHFFKSIPEHSGRILHVVVNINVTPRKVVTVFFDRRARRKK
jgi:hypothetical protein